LENFLTFANSTWFVESGPWRAAAGARVGRFDLSFYSNFFYMEKVHFSTLIVFL